MGLSCHTQMPHREFPFWFTYTWRGISLPLYGYGNKEDALHDTQQLHQVGQTCNSLLKLESACHRPPDGNLFWLSQNSSGVVPKLLVKVKDLTTTHSITVLDICTYKHISGCYHQIHNTATHDEILGRLTLQYSAIHICNHPYIELTPCDGQVTQILLMMCHKYDSNLIQSFTKSLGIPQLLSVAMTWYPSLLLS